MSHRISFGTFGSAAFCAAVLLSGCGSPAAGPASSAPASMSPGTTSASATASASPTAESPSPSSSSAPSSTTTAPAGWKSYTTPDGTLTFDYPATWSVKVTGSAAALVSDYGKTMATLRTQAGPAPACSTKSQFMAYDSAPIPALTQSGVTPRFAYEARVDSAAADPSKAQTYAYGITSAPKPTGTEACPFAQSFTWPPNTASFGGIYDPFDTTPGKPMHVDTPEVYKDTAEYKIIRQALLSLRPAGK